MGESHSALNRTTLRYVEDLSSLDDYPVEDWVHDPDMSEVDMDWPRYWKLTGDVVSEMSTVQQEAHDAADIDAIVASKVQQIDDGIASYIEVHYPSRRMLMLLMLSIEATDSSYANRKAYLAPLMAWIKSISVYFYTRRAELEAITTIRAVEAYTWDLAGTFDATDPEVTIEAAAAITD